ncbi:hypothetical protein AB837_00576 [bacterium AB1]|nr:hypothetical protein AB837_00576 [bacterium AB1]
MPTQTKESPMSLSSLTPQCNQIIDKITSFNLSEQVNSEELSTLLTTTVATIEDKEGPFEKYCKMLKLYQTNEDLQDTEYIQKSISRNQRYYNVSNDSIIFKNKLTCLINLNKKISALISEQKILSDFIKIIQQNMQSLIDKFSLIVSQILLVLEFQHKEISHDLNV